MKNYLGIISRSAQRRRQTNKMTLLCITLAVLMVTGIFSMADVAIQGERIHSRNKQGNWHFKLSDMSKEKLAEIANDRNVAVFSRYNAANYSLDEEYDINGKRAVLLCCDEGYSDIMSGFEKNSYPKNSDEIILNESMKQILGVQRGDGVILSTPEGVWEMTVSGFVDDNWLDGFDACEAFVTPEAFAEMTSGYEDESEGYYQLRNNRTARKIIDEITAKYDIPKENIKENTMLLAAYGNSGEVYITGIYWVAALLVVLVMAAGVLMIAGSISSNVSEKTTFYGMLRCIGAGKRQVMRIVRLEALKRCQIAVPVGVFLGTCGAWVLTAVLRNISSEFTDMPVFCVSIIGIAAGVVSGIITVWLAAALPARKAAKISPIAAVSGITADNGKHSKIRKLSQRPEINLGCSYAVESKKNVLMISGSFALCINVCLVFVSILQLLSLALPCLSAYSPDLEVYEMNYAPSLGKDLVSELNAMPEIKNAFGRMHIQTSVKSDSGVGTIDLISYDDIQFQWSKKDKLRGNIDKVSDEGYVMTVFDKNNPLDVGDVLYLNDVPLEVAAVLDDSPFSSSDIPVIICSEKTFESLMGESNYAVISIQMNKEYMDADQSIIRNLFEEGTVISDRRETNSETTATYYAFNITVYAFIILLALISVINIINSISMSTQAKMKQFGIMRAIGLDDRQLRNMISAQGTVYAVIGAVMGLAIGIPLHYASYTILVTRHFGDSWKFPIFAVLAILVSIAVATVAAVIFPVRKIERTPVTEVISEL